MSVDGVPDVRLYAFDHVQVPYEPYLERQKRIHPLPSIVKLPQHIVTCPQTLLELEERMLEEGYEGLILRSSSAPYKYGRSTVNEGYLLKLKRFLDAEATVIGFEERQHNGNESVLNELGRTSRSSHQAGKTGRGDLGALVVRFEDKTFNIGTGFDDAERSEIWCNKETHLGRRAKFKYFPSGNKDLPRFPVFLGWRADLDGA
jgi:DNA ligase-1